MSKYSSKISSSSHHKNQVKKKASDAQNARHLGNLFFDNSMHDDDLVTAEQLAKRLNIAVRTVRKWRYERVLPPNTMVKLRHQVRYRWRQVLLWLNTNEG
jgi:DNA-binding transcriptional regulator YiaG